MQVSTLEFDVAIIVCYFKNSVHINFQIKSSHTATCAGNFSISLHNDIRRENIYQIIIQSSRSPNTITQCRMAHSSIQSRTQNRLIQIAEIYVNSKYIFFDDSLFTNCAATRMSNNVRINDDDETTIRYQLEQKPKKNKWFYAKLSHLA